MPANLDGLVWVILLLGPLLILQRSLHREIQAVFLLLTRRLEIALTLFSLLFLPGVFLHEGSHYLMARLLGVRTGRLSLIPRPMKSGKLQLGFVETEATDIIRDALIGAAPLLVGGVVVAYTGLSRLGLSALWERWLEGGLVTFSSAIQEVTGQPDFWLWFYIAIAVSSTMLPSASDRRAWLPVAAVLILLLCLSLLGGAGPWLASHLAAPFNQVLRSIALVFGISLLVHLVLWLPVWGVRRLLSAFLRMEVA
ncbi:MAG: hypothetical protein JXB15_12550 [Anaerolineales bacterium]|nr:hypothetical protein [Anaerolineales bacterium]